MRDDGPTPPSDVLDALTSLGFNLNEGRAYAALLRLGPSTGYEVAQRADIPRSAVYGALRRLVVGGAARSISGTPERFVATPADALLAVLRKRFDASSGQLLDAIAHMDVSMPVPDAFSVRGYARVMEEASRLVASAHRCLVVSGWPRELERLSNELSGAQARGVYVVLFSHAYLSEELSGVHFSYGLTEADLEAFWHHRLVIVADDAKSLIAATEQNASDSAVLSEAPAIAEFAVGQIALDITLLSQRHDHDASAVMARILGERVGRLHTLLDAGATSTLGERFGATPDDRDASKSPKSSRRRHA